MVLSVALQRGSSGYVGQQNFVDYFSFTAFSQIVCQRGFHALALYSPNHRRLFLEENWKLWEELRG